jgi:hypothetical protein
MVTATIVPQKHDVDPGLAQWVKSQRVSYKRKHKVTDEREQLLNEVDFCWRRHEYKKRRTSEELTRDTETETSDSGSVGNDNGTS